MFWVALSALIMAMTGAGDDTHLFRSFLEALREGADKEVKDPQRRAQAVQTVDKTLADFRTHRDQVGKIAECVEKNDRRYEATADDYQRCLVGLESIWQKNVEKLIQAQQTFNAAVTQEERAAIAARLEDQ